MDDHSSGKSEKKIPNKSGGGMDSLKRYVKRNNKASPFKGDESGPWKGPKGVEQKDQYAKKSGKKVVEESVASAESTGGGSKGDSSQKGKKKLRSYLDT